MTRAARNATCCEHAASDHDTHGCAVNLSTHSRTYERCHVLVTADLSPAERSVVDRIEQAPDAPEALRCPEAWHTGLHAGLLRECRFPAKHRGWHRDESDNLSWGGKLTPKEKAMAKALRAAR